MSDTNKSGDKPQIHAESDLEQTSEDELLVKDFDVLLSMRGIVKAISMCFSISDQGVCEGVLKLESIDTFLLWMDTATGTPHEVALLKDNFYPALKLAFDEMKPKLAGSPSSSTCESRDACIATTTIPCPVSPLP